MNLNDMNNNEKDFANDNFQSLRWLSYRTLNVLQLID